MSAQKITIEGFLAEFKQRHEQMADRPFCWVLGSGASIQSGIPSGKDLAHQWLSELHRREDFNGLPIHEWATAKNLGIPGFEFARAANSYPWIYQRRFRDYKEQGYAFLEKTMDSAEPSFGYSVLAQIMATTPHKVAVTTNFDNLVADAQDAGDWFVIGALTCWSRRRRGSGESTLAQTCVLALPATQAPTATIASTMTGTLSGEGPCPGADRAWRPASPHSSTMRSLNPLTTFALSLNPGAV